MDRLDTKRVNSRRERGDFRLAFCSGATHLSVNRNDDRFLNPIINSPSLSPALLYLIRQVNHDAHPEFLRSVLGVAVTT